MEKFFKNSSSLNLIDDQELLLKRYSNINYILNLDFMEMYEILDKAKEKEVDEMLWERWLVDYRNMKTQETFTSFTKYKEMLMPTKSYIEEVDKEELIREAEEIERKIAERKRGDL